MGLIDKWCEQYSPKNLCANEGEMGSTAARLGDIYGALILLNVGLFCGILAFLLEIQIKKKRNICTIIGEKLFTKEFKTQADGGNKWDKMNMQS